MARFADDFYRRERKQKLRRHRVVHSHVHGKCLFLCLPLKVPWDGVLEEKSNVIFAGLAVLMNQGEITVDADEGVLRLKSDPGVSRMEFEADEEGFIPIRARGKLASDIKLYNET